MVPGAGYGPVVSYRIDAEDRLQEVDANWSAFARANQAPELLPERVLGQRLWRFLTGTEVVILHRALAGRVRAAGRAVAIPFRCDSPARRRLLRMEILPLAGEGLRYVSTILREEPRSPVALLAAGAPRSERLLVMCSWCKAVKTPAGWREVEEAVASLGLFLPTLPPAISHGICPACRDRLEAGWAAEA